MVPLSDVNLCSLTALSLQAFPRCKFQNVSFPPNQISYDVGFGFICKSISPAWDRYPDRTLFSTYLPLAPSHCNVDKSPGVGDSFLSSTLGGLLLFLRLDLIKEHFHQCLLVPKSSQELVLFNKPTCFSCVESLPYLWSLRFDFAGTGQGSVDLTHSCALPLQWWRQFSGEENGGS